MSLPKRTHKDILIVSEKKEEKILHRKTADFDFSKFTRKEINELAARMKRVMIEANGIGLAANQIGLDAKVFVAQIHGTDRAGKPRGVKDDDRKFYAIFNPNITKYSEKKAWLLEGCLSVVDAKSGITMYGEVLRSEKVTIEGLDKNGKKIKIKAFGLLAHIFQHETDHLNGILFVDKARNIHPLTEHVETDRKS